MRFLFQNDYYTVQNSQLQQLIQGNQARLLQAENAAQEEITSYLVQRFDVSGEFTDTAVWSMTSAYAPGNRVYLSAPNFDVTQSYSQYSQVLVNGTVYAANINVVPGLFNPTNWTAVGSPNDLFNAAFPFPKFNINSCYNVGDKVYWKGYVYTCTTATPKPSTEDLIQYVYISSIPLNNVFPDSVNNANGQYWGTKTAYTVPVNTIITNSTYWTKGDNRSQQTVTYLMDIALYHLHASIAPMNIPELRVKRYDDAIGWLRKVAKGEITANFPVLQPTQGLKRRFGGNIKVNNHYAIFFAFLALLQYLI